MTADDVLDVLIAITERDSRPVRVPGSLTRCACANLGKSEWCTRMGYCSPFSGTQAFTCSMPDTCAWQRPAWRPDTVLAVETPDRPERYEMHDRATRQAVRSVRRQLELAKSRDDLTGATARAWESHDWLEADLLRGKRSVPKHREYARNLLAAHIHAAITERRGK